MEPTDSIVLWPFGVLRGHLSLFRGLPPLPAKGSWWWFEPTSTLTIVFTLETPVLSDRDAEVVLDFGASVPVSYIGQDILVLRPDPELAVAMKIQPGTEIAIQRVPASAGS